MAKHSFSRHIVRLIVAAVLLGLTACNWGEYYVVNFDDTRSADTTLFRVTAQRYTDLSQGIPADCYLPDGTPCNEWTDVPQAGGPRRTSGISGAGLVQALLDNLNARKVVEISGIYQSLDKDGNPITLSGKVLVPADGKFERYILVSHYTIGSNKEAPSNAFPLEGLLCSLGYALVCPDYIGYGITADMIHPYLVMDLTAVNVLDMFFAVKRYFEASGIRPRHDDIYLMGYSQGGATTMAVEYMLEELYNPYIYADDPVTIRRVFAGGGPYDVKATYDRFISTNCADYPIAVPLVLQGMIYGNDLDLKVETIVKPWLSSKIDDWVNSKLYTTAQMNELIGTKVTSDMLTDIGMNVQSKEVSELYKAMVQNSIVSYAWVPQAPVYIMHSMDDETVTYLNATNAKHKWSDANIQYNFGHYGGHVKTCLRFLLTVQTLLMEDQQEENVNYLN